MLIHLKQDKQLYLKFLQLHLVVQMGVHRLFVIALFDLYNKLMIYWM